MTAIEAVMRAGLEDVIVGAVWDPEAVAKMREAGVGAEAEIDLGGHTDMPSIDEAGRIGETTHRSAFPEEYRYGNKLVRDWTEGRHFAVIEMQFGACKGGTRARTMARKV